MWKSLNTQVTRGNSVGGWTFRCSKAHGSKFWTVTREEKHIFGFVACIHYLPSTHTRPNIHLRLQLLPTLLIYCVAAVAATKDCLLVYWWMARKAREGLPYSKLQHVAYFYVFICLWAYVCAYVCVCWILAEMALVHICMRSHFLYLCARACKLGHGRVYVAVVQCCMSYAARAFATILLIRFYLFIYALRSACLLRYECVVCVCRCGPVDIITLATHLYIVICLAEHWNSCRTASLSTCLLVLVCLFVYCFAPQLRLLNVIFVFAFVWTFCACFSRHFCVIFHATSHSFYRLSLLLLTVDWRDSVVIPFDCWISWWGVVKCGACVGESIRFATLPWTWMLCIVWIHKSAGNV